ncbi:(Fe-S)-binding protein [Salinisphaera japonica]|uniref:Fe-S oxidoreductase n=1 Tax=Salinisphaera japonica YTM-1 TaxID=1209778 RepID=A0A423PPN0_9GAMM|nr:(Fe-S)-binding protein [Salinisphaera japonica]ROO27559.1 Fe-S oxidoreductase [Salinisphaera japonica YTM-1]
MTIGLFIPCFIDAFYPKVGIATLELLERLGCEVDYPFDQTCCGQPMVNAGCHPEAAATEQLFVDNFAKYDVIVAPSGSCIHQIRDNLTAIEQTPAVKHVRENSYELVEYLHDVLGVREFPWAKFPHRVGYHDSCNTLRNLGHGQPSELRGGYFSKPRTLLEAVDGIELVTPDRPDECCGFGGTFSVTEPEVSGRMGHDKVADHGRAGAAYIVSADTSCLMHQQGCAKRIGAPVAFKHIAEILNGDTA